MRTLTALARFSFERVAKLTVERLNRLKAKPTGCIAPAFIVTGLSNVPILGVGVGVGVGAGVGVGVGVGDGLGVGDGDGDGDRLAATTDTEIV